MDNGGSASLRLEKYIIIVNPQINCEIRIGMRLRERPFVNAIGGTHHEGK
jgi:hypothetical protein